MCQAYYTSNDLFFKHYSNHNSNRIGLYDNKNVNTSNIITKPFYNIIQ